MSMHEDWKNPAPRPAGMSTGAKVLIAIGVLGGLCVLVCCGGFLAIGWKVQKMAENMEIKDPAKIREMTTQIVDQIDIPPQFQPSEATDVFSLVREVKYQHQTEPDGMLTLNELPTNPGDDEMMVDEEIEIVAGGENPAASGQPQNQAAAPTTGEPGEPAVTDAEQSGSEAAGEKVPGETSVAGAPDQPVAGGELVGKFETREYEVSGQKRSFMLQSMTSSSGKPLRSVMGSFTGKGGKHVTLHVTAPADELDDAAIERLIKSIRVTP